MVGVQGKHLLVGGSISPWVEAVALALGAAKTTTSDYNQVESGHPKLDTVAVPQLLEQLYSEGKGIGGSGMSGMSMKKQFELVVSYSSVEHDGLGR